LSNVIELIFFSFFDNNFSIKQKEARDKSLTSAQANGYDTMCSPAVIRVSPVTHSLLISFILSISLPAINPKNVLSLYYLLINLILTTPPCTEEAEWIIFEQPIEMSKEQIQAFQQIFPDNHRHVQPLNNRELYETK
jgi:Eukaryotic-type carbonic anhydrase